MLLTPELLPSLEEHEIENLKRKKICTVSEFIRADGNDLRLILKKG